MSFKKLDVIFGWLTFAVAAVVYIMTIEPTASFWDCGEFITTAFKLEVGHPPGAPFFMLLGRFFTLFGYAPVCMNILSALAGAFTILFLFWSITHLTRKLMVKGEKPTVGETIAIIGSGIVGGLAYTFSDTFWFSAVEAEVYGTSSLFTALVFWAMLKWENVADEPHSNRWLILILYLCGLSIGVHLLNLLAIPAMVYIYYYKKYKVSSKGLFFTLVISGIILAAILYGIIPGVVTIATWFELLFVNGFGLPYNTGTFFYIALIVALLAYGIYYTQKKKKVLWNTIILGVTVVLIGYSTYVIVPVRSNANLPMDQNSPNNVFSLLSYLNREQYGSRPLFFGQFYNTPLDSNNPYVEKGKQRIPKDGKYVVSQVRSEPNYNEELCTIFPRMWSKSDPRHISAYKEWGGVKGIKRSVKNQSGQTEIIEQPTFFENCVFFCRYQLHFMYWRYFMWNFAGRQNDIQGNGEFNNGNWICGINFIDEARLGPQDNLPAKYANNRGRNKYYLLPLILGLIGILFQLGNGKKGRRDLWVVGLLFISTGIAIVMYLNQSPYQPRERDYAYAGSFYAFSIWIGLGVAGICQLFKKGSPNALVASLVSLLALGIPLQMAAENWDDHDRSGCTSARDFGANYLASVEPGGIIFTNGDNDTYPLWYNQEVEGVGTDKRVCNLSYFQTDWYVNQMQRKTYESDPLPISFSYDKYVQGTRDVVWIMEDARFKGGVELGKALEFVKDDSPATKITRADNAAYIPSRNLYMLVDKQAVLDNGVVPADQANRIVDTMKIVLKSSYITKDQLMLLDMLYNNNWKRPMYYAISVGSDKYMGLDNYVRLEGFAYRIVPIETKTDSYQKGYVATDIMYDNLMNKFRYGGISDPKVYVNENNSRMCMNLRNNFLRLSEALFNEGKKEQAIEVADKCFAEIPQSKVPSDYYTMTLAQIYFLSGAKDKAAEQVRLMTDEFVEELDYYNSLDDFYYSQISRDAYTALVIINQLYNLSRQFEDQTLANELKEKFELYNGLYNSRQQ